MIRRSKTTSKFPLSSPMIISAYFFTLPSSVTVSEDAAASAIAPLVRTALDSGGTVSFVGRVEPGGAGMNPSGMPWNSGAILASCAIRTFCTSATAVRASSTERNWIDAAPVGDFAMLSPKLNLRKVGNGTN